MRRYAWFAGLLISGFLFADEIENDCGDRYLFSTQEGSFCGELQDDVTLTFPFGPMVFSYKEIYALETEPNQNKVKLTTRRGEVYQGYLESRQIQAEVGYLADQKEIKTFPIHDIYYILSEKPSKNSKEILLLETKDGYVFPIDSDEGVVTSSRDDMVRVWVVRLGEDIKFPKANLKRLSSQHAAVEMVHASIKKREAALAAEKKKSQEISWESGRLFAMEDFALEEKEETPKENAKEESPGVFDEKYYEPPKEKYDFFLFTRKSASDVLFSFVKEKLLTTKPQKNKEIALASPDEDADE